PGIEPEHQPRIFERFYRADAGRSRELGGTGLGLAIVKHLAHVMGGEVGLESSANGSRFWLRLPSGWPCLSHGWHKDRVKGRILAELMPKSDEVSHVFAAKA